MTDAQLILTKITEIETKQEERHIENKNDLKILFKKYEGVGASISSLPCDTHTERMKWFGIGLKILYGVTISVLLIWVKIALAE